MLFFQSLGNFSDLVSRSKAITTIRCEIVFADNAALQMHLTSTVKVKFSFTSKVGLCYKLLALDKAAKHKGYLPNCTRRHARMVQGFPSAVCSGYLFSNVLGARR
jgi:hypothetical protein